MNTTKKIKGFTIIEMLIVLALTSLSISYSYNALNYMQRLFKGFSSQNNYIQSYIRIKKTIDYSALKAKKVVEANNNEFVFLGDTVDIRFLISETGIVLKKGKQNDSLQIKVEHLIKTYEPMSNTKWQSKLLKSLSFDYEYKKQRFSFSLIKEYDATIKLEMN